MFMSNNAVAELPEARNIPVRTPSYSVSLDFRRLSGITRLTPMLAISSIARNVLVYRRTEEIPLARFALNLFPAFPQCRLRALLYGLLIVGHGRRQILWFGVTAHPTAEWIANQITEACAWEQAPRYLIRDRDGAYVRSSCEGFYQWAFAIDRRRRAPLGKTDMLKG